jgi:hypothetical protein
MKFMKTVTKEMLTLIVGTYTEHCHDCQEISYAALILLMRSVAMCIVLYWLGFFSFSKLLLKTIRLIVVMWTISGQAKQPVSKLHFTRRTVQIWLTSSVLACHLRASLRILSFQLMSSFSVSATKNEQFKTTLSPVTQSKSSSSAFLSKFRFRRK